MKKITFSNRGYALQVGRVYKVAPPEFWLKDYSEQVELLKIGRRGMVTVAVVTKSEIVGIAKTKVQAADLIWNEA